ncbi:unnamed protein product [Cylicocyclus nassatus]|uniref:Uncharacterized protein n=1 Tax=Cylicocyclus nassatus TaxID=53992 RepID=A0AA36GQT8_CYLNA|nr:unnamed protein product [Cylicocyclus nassatus]
MNGGPISGKGGGLSGAGTSFVGDTNINSRTGGTFGGYKFDPVTGEFIPQITTAPTTATAAKLPWYERMTVKGKELLGAEGSRVAAQRGFLQTLRGKNEQTKSGSLERHKKIGSAVGGAIGSTAGGMIGSWAGDKLGNWVGGKFGGSKPSTQKGPTWSQRQQTKAETQYAKDNFLSSYGSMQKANPNAGLGSGKDAYRTLSAAQKGNAKARTAAMHYADAMANGDTAGDGKVKKLSKNIKKVKNKNAKVKAKVSGEGKVKKLSSNIKKVKNKNATVKASTSGEGKAKSLASAIKKVKSKNASVKASVSGQSKAKSLSSAINQVQNKNVSVTATVTGTGKVKALKAAIDTVKDKPVSVTASVSGTGAVRSLAAAINAVHSKTVTITANVVKNGALATGTPGASKAFGALATGTPAATTTEWSSNGGTKKGVYLVNDAPGPDFVEAFKTKGGLIGLFPKQRNLLVPLPEGTQVLNAKETKKKFPRLEKGTQKFDMPKFPKLKLGTPGATRDFGHSGDVQNNVQNHTSNNNTFNINVNVNGGNAGTNLANNIANAIGEKLRQQFPVAEI